MNSLRYLSRRFLGVNDYLLAIPEYINLEIINEACLEPC